MSVMCECDVCECDSVMCGEMRNTKEICIRIPHTVKATYKAGQACRKQFSVGPAGSDEHAKCPLGCLGHAPRNFSNFKPSEIVSGAIWR